MIRQTAWILAFFLSATPVVAKNSGDSGEIESLVREFVLAFNAHDQEVMASFYENFASTSFQDRRSEDENRQLHEKLMGQFGTLQLESIDSTSREQAVLHAESTGMGAKVQVRFELVGNPPRIDGFRIGMSGAEHGTPPASVPASHGAEHATEREPVSYAEGPFGFLAESEDVYQPQLLVHPSGTLILVWVQAGAYDLDLYVATKNANDAFSHPLRINHAPVNSYTGDEARPSVALGPEGRIAVAWTAANGDIMLAVGAIADLAFNAPVKLNQDQQDAYRTMPVVTFTPDGAANAIWIDGRKAEKGQEEPADLYYARVIEGRVEESNLTEQQEASICGCCRPFIRTTASGDVDIAFRNTTSSGYRDIFTMSSDSGGYSEPIPTGPPLWKIMGCPMAGPIRYEEGTLWRDASQGSWRLLWSTDSKNEPLSVLGDLEDLDLSLSPRTVSGADNLVLIGSSPNNFILERQGTQWQTVHAELPEWASSAARHGDEIVVVGSDQGRFRVETLTVSEHE